MSTTSDVEVTTSGAPSRIEPCDLAPSDLRVIQTPDPPADAGAKWIEGAGPSDGPPLRLADLLQPFDESTFFAQTWDEAPLIVAQEDRGRFTRLLPPAHLDFIVAAVSLATIAENRPSIRLLKDAVDIPIERCLGEEGTIDVGRVFAEYQRGATVVLNGMRRAFAPIRALCRELEGRFGHPVGANVYLSPPRSQGFAPHYDGHDIFVLQLAGAKRWRVYGSPIRLPIESQPYVRPEATPERLTHAFELRAGDMIYLPRGYVHEGSTSDEASMHLTLSVETYVWADVLRELVDLVGSRDLRLRRAVPVGLTSSDAVAAPLEDRLGDVLRAFSGGVTLEDAARLLAGRFDRDRLPPDEPISAAQLDAVEGATRLRRRTEALGRVIVEGDAAILAGLDRRIVGPRRVEQALRFAIDTSSFEVGAIPGLTAAGQRVLARRLIEEGFSTPARGR